MHFDIALHWVSPLRSGFLVSLVPRYAQPPGVIIFVMRMFFMDSMTTDIRNAEAPTDLRRSRWRFWFSLRKAVQAERAKSWVCGV